MGGADDGGYEDCDVDGDARLEDRAGGTALCLYILSKARKEAECEPLVSVCAVVKWSRRARAVGVHAMPLSSSTEAIYRRQNYLL